MKSTNQEQKKFLYDQLRKFNNYKVVLIPVFSQEENSISLVEVDVAQLKIDLYCREGQEGNEELSEMVLSMLRIQRQLIEEELDEDAVDGGVEEVPADSGAQMLIAVCSLAEKKTFGEGIDLQGLDLQFQGKRLLDLIIQFLVG